MKFVYSLALKATIGFILLQLVAGHSPQGFEFEDTGLATLDTDPQRDSQSLNAPAVLLAKRSSHIEQLSAPNCMDLAFMQTDGLRACNRNSVALEVSEVAIAIANCYLKNQIRHLAKEEIRCRPGDSACLGSLKEYQRRILMSVSSQLGLYCSVHLMRREKHKFASSLKECSKTAVNIQEILKQTKQVHEAVLQQENISLKLLEDLSTQAEKQTRQEMKAVEQQINQLEKEVQTLETENEDTQVSAHTSRIEQFANKLDFFVYFVIFCMQVLIILILTVLLPGVCDVSIFEAFVPILLGWFANLALSGLQTGANYFATIIPASYFQVVKLALFFYFVVLRYFFLLVRTTPGQQETLLISQILETCKELTSRLSGSVAIEQSPFKEPANFDNYQRLSPLPPSTRQTPSRQVFAPIQRSPVRLSETLDENTNPNTRRRDPQSRGQTGSKLRSEAASARRAEMAMQNYTNIPPIQLR